MLEVRPRLLLGSMGDALAVLSRVPSVTYTVTHLLSVCNEAPDLTSIGEDEPEGGSAAEETKDNIQKMFVQVTDRPTSDLLEHFEPCVKFIKVAVEQGTILVHCEYGVSRSVTVVLAYLMWSERSSFQILFQQLKAKKPEIRPNAGFVEQLKLWERMKCRIDQSDKLYRAHCLRRKAKEMKDWGIVEEVNMSPDPFLHSRESTGYFRCRKCRRLLFTDDSVLQHELGQGQAAFNWHKRQLPPVVDAPHPPAAESEATSAERGTRDGEEMERIEIGVEGMTVAGDTPPDSDSDKTEDGSRLTEISPMADSLSPPSPVRQPSLLTPSDMAQVRAQVASVVALGNMTSISSACSSYFVEPVEWMGDLVLGEVEGKVHCPKCNARLGSFNWAGEQCSCGRWMTPSFQIHRSRVDETRSLTRRKNTGQ